MAYTGVVSIHDGPRTTVADLIGNPRMIPTRIIELLKNQFLGEVLLRDGGPNPNGLVAYNESTPLYLGSDVADVAEFAEIPVASGSVGTSRIAVAGKRGLGLQISKEMKDENRVGDVNRAITQLTNTIVRAQAKALLTLLNNPAVPSIPASAAWDTSTGAPRHDIALAMEKVGSATPTGTDADEDFYGFVADSIVLPTSIAPVLMDNDDFLKVYKDSLAPEAINYTGKLPKDVMGLAGLTSRVWPKDRVLVTERGTLGFYSDTRPLQVTEVYPEGNGPNGGPNETWRSDATYKRAFGLDQPTAACWITGIITP